MHQEDDDDGVTVHQRGQLPLSAQSAYSAVPTRRNTPSQFTYFNNGAKKSNKSTYDRLFNYETGYNNKLHRCDREHTKNRGLDVHSEQVDKAVPIRMSGVYGHRIHQAVDVQDRKHVHIIKTKEFSNNTGVSHNIEDSYGGILPQ